MQIDQVNIYPVLLPFSDEFSHSLRKRKSANNVVVEVVAAQGTIKGYGEGAPRSYVTGESQESVAKSIRLFTQQETFPWNLNDVSQIWNFVDSITQGKDVHSAICALESALLDSLGQSQARYLTEYFPKDFYAGQVFYRATLPLASKQRILQICRLCQKMKINKLRIKVGKDYVQNRSIMEAVRSVFGEDYELRVDINGSWNRELAWKHLQLFQEYKIKIIEQPLMPGDPYLADLAELMQKQGIILMADESACTLNDAEAIVKDGHYQMVNVRLSKCGGFRNSLKIINYLRRKKILFQIGCHLGESGILSAAGRVLCLLCKDAAYHDGSYDEFILKENITVKNVSFGPGGEAGPLQLPGLGIEVNRKNLMRFSQNAAVITISPDSL